MNKINHIRLIVILLCSITLPGCIKEDLADCPVDQDISHYLTFEYTKNTDFVDKFADAVATLDVFVFDSDGILTGILSEEGTPLKNGNYRMILDLPDGTYTFIIWGGSRKSYQISQATDHYRSMIGSARLDQLRLALNNNCTFENTDDLFHGIAQNVFIHSEQSSHTHISLTKNTNIINAKVYGISNLANAGNSMDVICSAANGELNFDNSISNPESLIQYIPVQTETKGELKVGFKTLRLLTGMKSAFTIRNTNSNEEIFNHSLIELIKLLPDIHTDEDLDRNDVYDVEIYFDTNLSASVTINGYLVISSDQEIQ
ncbi:MAG: FimB/Mfa2 family fimbrial subunit [Bacteroidales bacterium]|jgi:hypothetical protein|nr:FimB/Mfa2 family fimbrial subunit [Bacteroidales bacterium]